MRSALTSLCLAALVVATPVAAASSLRGLMKGWKADARATNDMLSGRTRFDEAAVRAALQTYVDEAGQVAAQVNGNGADARDIKARFLKFQSDSRSALGDVARPPALKAAFNRVTADCQSCHDTYKD